MFRPISSLIIRNSMPLHCFRIYCNNITCCQSYGIPAQCGFVGSGGSHAIENLSHMEVLHRQQGYKHVTNPKHMKSLSKTLTEMKDIEKSLKELQCQKNTILDFIKTAKDKEIKHQKGIKSLKGKRYYRMKKLERNLDSILIGGFPKWGSSLEEHEMILEAHRLIKERGSKNHKKD